MAWQGGTASNPNESMSLGQYSTRHDSGHATVTAGQVVKAVAFGAAKANANYTVVAGAPGNFGVWVTNKTVNGFDLNISAPQGADVILDWDLRMDV